MSAAPEALPIPPHLASEFYLWLWWSTEERATVFDLGGRVGRVDLWVDDRLAFRHPHEAKVTAVMTGENPADTLEARAALAGGKVVSELRLHLRREDHEFTFTLKGPAMDIVQARLPQVVQGGDEAIYDRMFLYGELSLVLQALLREFAAVRSSPDWEARVLPAIRRWSLLADADSAG